MVALVLMSRRGTRWEWPGRKVRSRWNSRLAISNWRRGVTCDDIFSIEVVIHDWFRDCVFVVEIIRYIFNRCISMSLNDVVSTGNSWCMLYCWAEVVCTG